MLEYISYEHTVEPLKFKKTVANVQDESRGVIYLGIYSNQITCSKKKCNLKFLFPYNCYLVLSSLFCFLKVPSHHALLVLAMVGIQYSLDSFVRITTIVQFVHENGHTLFILSLKTGLKTLYRNRRKIKILTFHATVYGF